MTHRRVRVRAFSLVLIGILSGCAGSNAVGPSLEPQTQAASHPHPRVVRKASSGATDWDSFGFDLQRSGFNPFESKVGVSNVGSLQQLWSVNVGFGMVHEPVLAS